MQRLGIFVEFMMQIVPITVPDAILRAAATLARGELVVVPTDTVYGVACSPFDSAAIERIFAAKQRPPDKAIAVLLADVENVQRLAAHISPSAQKLAACFWPGPLTMVLPKRDGLPSNLSAYPTIGLRVPDHDGCRAFIRAVGGAIAATSANRSGAANPTTVEEASAQLGETVAMYLDGGKTAGDKPSTVVSLEGEKLTVLRHGPITEAMLDKALRE